MNSNTIEIEGITLLKPTELVIPWKRLEEFPSCCGPGCGILELTIPEYFFWLRMSHCCWIHDNCFKLSKLSWNDFRLSNEMFKINLKNTIEAKPSYLPPINYLRQRMANRYVKVVQSDLGLYCFLKVKREQMEREC